MDSKECLSLPDAGQQWGGGHLAGRQGRLGVSQRRLRIGSGGLLERGGGGNRGVKRESWFRTLSETDRCTYTNVCRELQSHARTHTHTIHTHAQYTHTCTHTIHTHTIHTHVHTHTTPTPTHTHPPAGEPQRGRAWGQKCWWRWGPSPCLGGGTPRRGLVPSPHLQGGGGVGGKGGGGGGGERGRN